MDWWWTRIENKLDQILKKEGIIVDALTDLQKQVDALKQGQADLKTSVDAEIVRVEAVISYLQAGSVSAADVEKAATDLEAVVDGLKAAKAALDSERP